MKLNILWGSAALVIMGMVSCTPAKGPSGLGPLPKASFTVTPLAGAVNQYVLTSTSSGGFSYYWNQGTGGSTVNGGTSDTVYYNKQGTYSAELIVIGKGGYDTATQVISVPTTDPGVNILQNSSLTSATNWTVLNTGGTQTQFTFGASGLNVTNGASSGTNGGVYQAVQVKANTPYIFNAVLSGPGASNCWFEFYIGATVPTQGKDYTDNKVNSLNTWSGCGVSAFTNASINVIGCSGTNVGQNGSMTFKTSGTVYVMIKAGVSGGSMGTGGITVSSITLNEPTP
ncbi:hypothetical protein [Dinghuibacter silviterrae]|uniref:PKD domain-containing protein n=1 Tax=Dinghuibacter silviterrae TaxID=1539049 RepID=A0A4R8DSG2_9BACT|nr:hypothetical protein [Dinghuibacter silviterrae]TDX01160.1 hypothetical protein EDB95_2191 [Dinghuibacter silviterrae]